MKFLKDYTPEEQELLRNVVCPGAKDGHVDYYLRTCSARGVDPFSGLLYLQVRSYKGELKASIDSTIDGARAVADGAGNYAGSDEPEYDSEDGKAPKWCRVTVYKIVGDKEERVAFTAKCRFDEFKPSAPNDFQWNAKPYHMLAKCTEKQALRKGWPRELAESETAEHLDESGPQAPKAVEDALAKSADHSQGRWVNAVRAFSELGIDEKAIRAKLGNDGLIGAVDYERLEAWYKELERGEQTA